MVIQLLKKIFDRISQLVSSFVYRWERRVDNPYGYAFGGPKKAKWKFLILLVSIVVLAVGTALINRGVITSVEQNLDRETAPGAKLQTEVAGGISRDDILHMEEKTHELEQKPDCDKIMANLRVRGTLTKREAVDFDRYCREKVGKATADVIDKVISGEVPASVASEIMQSLTQKNAEQILNALGNDEVKKALRTDAGSVLARNLGSLGNLSDAQLSESVRLVKATPPQFRDDAIEAVKSVAALESPEARDSMLRVVSRARSADELRDARSFADTVAKTKPDEQKVFSSAYEKAPDPATRKALARAAGEIVQLAADDPVRGKLVQLVRATSELPPEEQKNAYNKLADVASAYRSATDPDIKRAIGDALAAADGPADVASLGKRLADLKEAEKTGGLDKDNRLAAIAGGDSELVAKVAAAAELIRSGDVEAAKKAIDGSLSDDAMVQILKRAEQSQQDPFSRVAGKESEKIKEEVSGQRLKEVETEKKTVENKKKNIEIEIVELMRGGAEAGDPRLVDLYGRLGQSSERLRTLSDSVADIRLKLRAKLLELKNRTKSEFEAAGVVMPDVDIKIPDDVAARSAPDERLSNLREVSEFWSLDGGSVRNKRGKYAKFSFGNGGVGGDAGQGGGGSLLAAATKKTDKWLMGPPGAGSQGGQAAASEFEMSRLLHIPGVLRRIPGEGISSKTVGSTTVLFEFLESVINRKTGLVDIPQGAVAICKCKDFDVDTGRLNASCSTVDVGGREDIRTNFSLGDASGADGVMGGVINNRGWFLSGIFLTAFSAAILDGVSQSVIAPYQARAAANGSNPANYLVVGGSGGASRVLQQVAQKQVEEWQNGVVWWIGYDGMLATVRQQ